MKKFDIAVPMRGFQTFIVEALSEDNAIELIMNGEVNTEEYDDIEWELDTNLWDIEEINE